MVNILYEYYLFTFWFYLFNIIVDVVYGKNIDIKSIVKFALGAAEGIRYLHAQKPPIIHRDLKTMNFLVGKDNCVKVSDFGLAKHLESKTTQTFCGTVPWTAPELLRGNPYTTKVDVYSFGIVIWGKYILNGSYKIKKKIFNIFLFIYIRIMCRKNTIWKIKSISNNYRCY